MFCASLGENPEGLRGFKVVSEFKYSINMGRSRMFNVAK